MSKVEIKAQIESWPIDGVFRISHGERTEAEIIVVTISKDGAQGQGESVPYSRYNENTDSVMQQINDIKDEFADNLNHEHLLSTMEPGAARNALDLALWDLECKTQNKSIYEILDINPPESCITAYTIVIDTKEKMAKNALKNAFRPVLKVKLCNDGQDLEKLKAIKQAAPKSDLIIDANEGWNKETYLKIINNLVDLGVKLIEQPFPSHNDNDLLDLPKPIPICADESCHVSTDLSNLLGKYQVVNIKLDKTGGLTEALNLSKKAKEMGFKIMIGCMVGTSLAIAPNFCLIQAADFIDIDAPLLLKEDRPNGVDFKGSRAFLPSQKLWG